MQDHHFVNSIGLVENGQEISFWVDPNTVYNRTPYWVRTVVDDQIDAIHQQGTLEQ